MRLFVVLCLLSVVACGGGRRYEPGAPSGPSATRDGGTAGHDSGTADPNVDPRCEAACVAPTPTLDGAYDVCSAESVASCKAQCTRRIVGLSPGCAACLSGDVGFVGRPSQLGPTCGESAACATEQCGFTNGIEVCLYCADDAAARDACVRQIHPRREVWCGAVLSPDVDDCEDVCAQDLAVAPPPVGDPRCDALCREDPPRIDGAGEVCSAASLSSCKAACEARIAGASSLCASCLLEEAELDDRRGPSNSPSCQEDEGCGLGLRCRIDGESQECFYCIGDRVQYEACLRRVDPRTEVECRTDFGSPSCAAVCAG